MTMTNENTGAASGLSAAAGYAEECAKWNERQSKLRSECAENIAYYLKQNDELHEADKEFHRTEMAFESDQAAMHQRWANGIREVLSHITESNHGEADSPESTTTQ